MRKALQSVDFLLTRRNIMKKSFDPLTNSSGMDDVKTIDNNGLKQIDSDWAKRLAYGTERTMYTLSFDFV